MIRLLVAMDRELEKLDIKDTLIERVDLIGIGGTDLPDTSEDDIIINIGYAGGWRVPIGAVIEPTFSLDYTSGSGAMIDHIFSEAKRCRCYTADEFVTEPCVSFPAIYDMELNKILRLPHKKLYALKIVSDRLNEADCELFNGDESWPWVTKLLKRYF